MCPQENTYKQQRQNLIFKFYVLLCINKHLKLIYATNGTYLILKFKELKKGYNE